MALTQKKFKKTFDSLESIFDFTQRFFSTERIDPSHLYAVNFAVEELFTNMVKYSPESTKDILVGLDRADDRLRITLTDFDVEPFDVTAAGEVDTDLPLEQRKVGGLGLQLTKKMMDGIDYEYSNRQSRITLTKVLGQSDV